MSPPPASPQQLRATAQFLLREEQLNHTTQGFVDAEALAIALSDSIIGATGDYSNPEISVQETYKMSVLLGSKAVDNFLSVLDGAVTRTCTELSTSTASTTCTYQISLLGRRLSETSTIPIEVFATTVFKTDGISSPTNISKIAPEPTRLDIVFSEELKPSN
eukprot:3701861-Pleurochrysis_carterae.AAC.1